MDKQRREFIHSFAGLGAMSAAAAAMGATGSTHAQTAASLAPARGDAIKGPYLDLTTGKGNQLAWARLNGDLDETQQKHGWFKGYVMAVRPGKKVEDLFGFEGFDSSRLEKRADGSYAKILREVVLYTDLKTGEVLEDWHNPYNDETVRVVHVANDPYNYMIEEYAPQVPDYGTPKKESPPRQPFLLGWQQYGNRLDMEIHVHLLYPNLLKPEKWVRESAGPMVRVSEMYSFHVDAAQMQDKSYTTLPFSGYWNRITPWLPWMLMGQTPGYCQYACFHGSGDELEAALSRQVLDYVEKHYAKYFKAPDKWEEPSLSSLERYAIEQQPVPVK
ncbi:MAG: DUF1838 domain-containing protein [Gammaproteobacteria bacterium]|nr:DUF1838 domain-containing protein [Gammaproteobacteria bacterium]